MLRVKTPFECWVLKHKIANGEFWDKRKIFENNWFARILRGTKVLDVGAGGNPIGAYYAALGADVTVLDPWRKDVYRPLAYENEKDANWHEYIKRATEADYEVIRQKLEDFTPGNAANPFDGFDMVTCICVLEHIEYDVDFIDNLLNLVAPGGLLLLSTHYNKKGRDYDGNDRCYTKSSLKKLFDNINFKYKMDFTKEIIVRDEKLVFVEVDK